LPLHSSYSAALVSLMSAQVLEASSQGSTLSNAPCAGRWREETCTRSCSRPGAWSEVLMLSPRQAPAELLLSDKAAVVVQWGRVDVWAWLCWTLGCVPLSITMKSGSELFTGFSRKEVTHGSPPMEALLRQSGVCVLLFVHV